METITLPDIRKMSGFSPSRRILVLGCGGTGAYVAGHLARLIMSLNSERSSYDSISLVLADGDKVERKNLERQHFVQRDLDTNKAEALARRYSSAFGLQIDVIPSYLEDEDSIRKTDIDMVIGCVDNNASRKIVHEWMLNSRSREKFWVDCGNEESSGQVVCGFSPNRHIYGSSRSNSFSLPMVTEIYPGLLSSDGKFNSQLSCAELAQSAPQNMMANITAASIALNFVQCVLRGKPLMSHGVVFSVDNSFRTILNTPENLAKVNKERLRSWETTEI